MKNGTERRKKAVTEWIRFGIVALLLLSGVTVIFLSVLGVFRFHFVLNRMHCAAIIDTLGVLLVFAGLMVAADKPVYILKLLAVLAFIWIGSPISSHLVSRTEVLTDEEAKEHMDTEKDAGRDMDDIR